MTTGYRDDLVSSEQARFGEVCRFGQDRIEEVARAVAAAFADDPVWHWTFDIDDTVPVEVGMPLARMLVARSAAPDEIHGFRHFGAVALWTAPMPERTPDAEARVMARVQPHAQALMSTFGERQGAIGELGQAMNEHRPEQPHWYLNVLATEPERQGQGLGGRVLQTMIDRCDRIGLPIYLESSNPRNYGFYQRHGFAETETFSGGGSPPLRGFFRDVR